MMDMAKSLELLSSIPFFSGLSPAQLNEVGRIAFEKYFNKGEIIFSDGEEGDGSYLIIEGTVKVFKLSLHGKEHIFHFFSSGWIFGEVAVFAGEHFPLNAEAITETRVLFFPLSAFLTLIRKHQVLALKMLADLSHKYRILIAQIENLSSKEISARLAGYLLLESQGQCLSTQIVLKISKTQLASMLGTVPETLSRVFTKLSKHSLIRVEGRKIVLLNKAKLAELAETGKILC
jgi:CRP/FNR family transcriptional regulator, dissimilatory nitrate respiration regulator